MNLLLMGDALVVWLGTIYAHKGSDDSQEETLASEGEIKEMAGRADV
ncbi:hypothetical protein [Burkholderia singularis]|nr:hypothetical protein [Burkholderia sp. Bp7605]